MAVKYCSSCLTKWSSDIRAKDGTRIPLGDMHETCRKALEALNA